MAFTSVPVKIPPPPSMRKIASFITEENLTNIDITGMDLNRDQFYEIKIATYNNGKSGSTYKLFYEGDYNDSNYHSQHLPLPILTQEARFVMMLV